MYRVLIQEHPVEDVHADYRCVDAPYYTAVPVEVVAGDPDRPMFERFVNFIPLNGYHAGQPHSVPASRLIGVIEEGKN